MGFLSRVFKYRRIVGGVLTLASVGALVLLGVFAPQEVTSDTPYTSTLVPKMVPSSLDVPPVDYVRLRTELSAAASSRAAAAEEARRAAAARKAAAEKAARIAAEKAAAAKQAAEGAAKKKAEELAAAKAAAAKAAAAKAAATTTPPAPTAQVMSVDAYKGYAASKLGNEMQFSCLDEMWNHESSWNPNAQNPTSTAYGIPQFLDSTWASVGGVKTSDPYKQIDYGLVYINQSYGDPCSAWAFWQANNYY